MVDEIDDAEKRLKRQKILKSLVKLRKEKAEEPLEQVAKEFDVTPEYVFRAETADMADDFEVNIAQYLKAMGFNHIEGTNKKAGTKFTLDLPSGNILQIDAAGIFEKRLYVVECKLTRTENGKYSGIQSEFNHHQDRVRLIKQELNDPCTKANEIKLRDWEKNCEEVVAVAALKNIKLSGTEHDKADDCSIKIWDDNFVAYYRDLSKKIGEYATYDMLGDMGIRNNDEDPPAAFCLKTDMEFEGETVDVFQFLMDPRDLLKIATVARRERPHEKFYQRSVEESRLQSIANFLKEGNVTPNNIVIGMEGDAWKDAVFSPLKVRGENKESRAEKLKVKLAERGTPLQFGTLTFPRQYRSCWVIDGQHRLYGIAKKEKSSTGKDVSIVKSNMKLPIIAFGGIPQEQMASMFLNINDKQKKISPDLKYDLYAEYIPEKPDGVICRTIKAIDIHTSELTNRIYYPSKGLGEDKTGKIPIATMYAAIKTSKLTTDTLSTKHRIPNPLIRNKPSSKSSLSGWNKSVVTKVSDLIGDFYNILVDEYPESAKRGSSGFIFHPSTCKVIIPLLGEIISDYGKPPTGAKLKSYAKGLGTFFDDMEDHNIREAHMRSSSRAGDAKDVIIEMAKSIQEKFPRFGDKTDLLTREDTDWKKLEVLFGRYVEHQFSNWRDLIKGNRLSNLNERAQDEGKKNVIHECLRMDDIRLIILSNDPENLSAVANEFSETPHFGGSKKMIRFVENKVQGGIEDLAEQFQMQREGKNVPPGMRDANRGYITAFAKAITQIIGTGDDDEEDEDED